MITQAIQLHFNSDMHSSAIEKEHLKQISPFQEEHESRKQCENEVLNKVFMSIYWLAKEEISNKTFVPFKLDGTGRFTKPQTFYIYWGRYTARNVSHSRASCEGQSN